MRGQFVSQGICRVSEKEFENAKTFDQKVVITESCIGEQETVMAFCPRCEWAKPFIFYRRWQ